MRFAEGHTNVLKSYGIKKVTSSNTEWFNDPGVYVIMVESLTGDEIYGGARLHVKGAEYMLPIEEAIGELDAKIFDLIGKHKENKTGELCGLWNTKGMSGSGLSIILIRVGIAKAGIYLAEKLNLKSLHTLAAPWTLKMVESVGFKKEENIGDKGTFPYPRPDLLATVFVIKDVSTLKSADQKERKNILDLRNNPKQTKLEDGPKGQIEVEYDLLTAPSISRISKKPLDRTGKINSTLKVKQYF